MYIIHIYHIYYARSVCVDGLPKNNNSNNDNYLENKNEKNFPLA